MTTGNTPHLIVHAKQNEAVVVGCPFPAQIIPEPDCQALVHFAGGLSVPAQCVSLTPVMTNGVRWLELSFRSAGQGEAQVELQSSNNSEPRLADQSEDAIHLNNTDAHLCLNADISRPPLELQWHDDSPLGTFSPEVELSDGSLLREPQEPRRKLSILRNGPLRAQAELCGVLTDGVIRMEYRLTVELWQGSRAARIDWMLIHNQPGVADLSIARASLLGQWQLGGNVVRRFLQSMSGHHYNPRIVENPDPVCIIADDYCSQTHVSDPAMLLDDCEYPHYLSPPVIQTGEWLQMKSTRGCVHATVADFTETRPNALSSSDSELSYHLVPAGQPVTWPQGRRKEQTLLLAWDAQAVEPDELVQKANEILTFNRALPTPAYLRSLQCFDQHLVLSFEEPGRHLRFQAVLDTLCRVETPGQMWDLGDCVDQGYTRHYSGGFHQYCPRPGVMPFPRQYVAGENEIFPAASTLMMEPVWTNNEYDMIHMLAMESMRTGRKDHMRMLRWSARHNVEVDFVCYSDDPWHHRATPFHSRHHNTRGAMTSHFWPQGLLEYYCLSGDRDALEVALALGDKIKEIDDSSKARIWKFDREVGWALLALVCLVEAGYDEYQGEADRVAGYIQNYDRAAFTGKVNLSLGTEGNSLERQMVEASFGYASMLEAFDRYLHITRREDTRTWLETLLGQMKAELWEQFAEGHPAEIFSMITLVMAIGYEHTDDPEYLDAGEVVFQIFLDPLWQKWSMYAGFADAKFRTMAYRALDRFLGHLDRTGRLDDYELPALKRRRS